MTNLLIFGLRTILQIQALVPSNVCDAQNVNETRREQTSVDVYLKPTNYNRLDTLACTSMY